MPTYDGTTPTKVKTEQYVYTFKGWNKTIQAVTGDATYVAQYERSYRPYTITWKNEDGSILKTDEVPYGTTPKYEGATPTKEPTDAVAYLFDGWDQTLAVVSGEATYVATFKAVPNSFTVTWQDEDGTELEKDEDLKYGTMPSFDGTEPTKDATEKFTYTFDGWTPEVVSVAGDATYVAKFKAVAIPGNDNNKGNNANKAQLTVAPRTSDNISLAINIMILIASILGMAGCIAFKRKRL